MSKSHQQQYQEWASRKCAKHRVVRCTRCHPATLRDRAKAKKRRRKPWSIYDSYTPEQLSSLERMQRAQWLGNLLLQWLENLASRAPTRAKRAPSKRSARAATSS